MQNTILEMKNIVKEFNRNKVLKGVSLQVDKGEIVSLVGENGAGKSTLMNILFGMAGIVNTGGYEGQIIWEGQPVQMVSPGQAMNLGIGMVHQEFMLLPSYTVTENVKLNRENTKHNVVSRLVGSSMSTLDRRHMKSDTKEALDKIHLKVDPSTVVGSMSVGYKQFVEIAREIDKKNIKLIVFDEPTAVLTDMESTWLLDTIREISAAGVAVIFISHKLDEVMEISDKIVVLRDGELVDTIGKGEVDVVGLAKLMAGRNVDFSAIAGRPPEEMGKNGPIMQIKGLGVKMPGENVKGVDIDIHKGEILGFCGLAGQGKLAIANGIAGLYPSTGEVIYKGKKLPFGRPLEILKSGIGFVSEDRSGIGLLMDESIRMNICLLAMHAVVDVYDALSSRRPYKGPLPQHKCLSIIYSMREEELDPYYVDRFIRCLNIYPLASAVELSNGFRGVVAMINEGAPMLPVVIVTQDNHKANMAPRVVDLSSCQSLYIDHGISMDELGVDPVELLKRFCPQAQ